VSLKFWNSNCKELVAAFGQQADLLVGNGSIQLIMPDLNSFVAQDEGLLEAVAFSQWSFPICCDSIS